MPLVSRTPLSLSRAPPRPLHLSQSVRIPLAIRAVLHISASTLVFPLITRIEYVGIIGRVCRYIITS